MGRLGKKSWSEVSRQLYYHIGKQAKLYRLPKHCRERWTSHLNPEIRKGPWVLYEDLILLKSFLEIGNKWAAMTKFIGGRT